MNEKLISLIRKFVLTQRGLCAELERKFQPDELLLRLPKRGMLDQNGEYWEFHRHGTGVCFRSPSSGVEIDVTDNLKLPVAFDPWRFMSYCRSLSLDKVSYRGLTYPLSDKAVSALFTMLLTNGELEKCTGAENLFMLSEPARPT